MQEIWDEFKKDDKNKKEAVNQSPKDYAEDEQYQMILCMSIAGEVSLDSFVISDPDLLCSMLVQATASLATAEKQFQFEHRDAHTSNIMVHSSDESFIDYNINDQNIKVKTFGKIAVFIDFGNSRLTKGIFYILFS